MVNDRGRVQNFLEGSVRHLISGDGHTMNAVLKIVRDETVLTSNTV